MGFFDIESGPAARFNTIGDSVSGVLSEPYSVRQATEFGSNTPKVDANGREVMMAVITLQTDQRDPTIEGDDGTRVVYADKFGLRKAISEAVKTAGASDLEVGGRLTVTYSGDLPSGKGNPTKDFTAQYVKANSIMTAAEPAAAQGYASGGVITPPQVATLAVSDDLVAAARAAQTQAAARSVASVPNTPALGSNGSAAADLLKIRQLGQMGFDAPAIHAAMKGEYELDAIVAALQV